MHTKGDAKGYDPSTILTIVLAALEGAKSENIITIALSQKTTIADFMVVTTGRSTRHVDAIAGRVAERLKANGTPPLSIEGRKNCSWVLIDGQNVIVHIFQSEVRAQYQLEKMWSVELTDNTNEHSNGETC